MLQAERYRLQVYLNLKKKRCAKLLFKTQVDHGIVGLWSQVKMSALRKEKKKIVTPYTEIHLIDMRSMRKSHTLHHVASSSGEFFLDARDEAKSVNGK